jgi:hypothetical protein
MKTGWNFGGGWSIDLSTNVSNRSLSKQANVVDMVVDDGVLLWRTLVVVWLPRAALALAKAVLEMVHGRDRGMVREA